MQNQTDDDATDDWRTPNENRRGRMGMMLQRALVPGAEAQKSMARNLERSTRLMLSTAIAATISTIVSVAGFVFVVVYLLRSQH